MVRKGDRLAAIQHSKRHLAPWAGLYLEDFQRAMTALVFGADTSCPPYQELFAASQWDSIVDLFYQELFRLNNMTQNSLLTIQLQVGVPSSAACTGSCALKEE